MLQCPLSITRSPLPEVHWAQPTAPFAYRISYIAYHIAHIIYRLSHIALINTGCTVTRSSHPNRCRRGYHASTFDRVITTQNACILWTEIRIEG